MGRARRLNKRIEIWETTQVPDGFGGNTISESLITTTWAELKQLNANSRFSNPSADTGIFDPSEALVFRVRKNSFNYNHINQFIIYQGFKYIINTRPVDVNFDHRYIEFVATVEAIKTVEPVGPIVQSGFNFTFNFPLT